jgi:hypothetical protein
MRKVIEDSEIISALENLKAAGGEEARLRRETFRSYSSMMEDVRAGLSPEAEKIMTFLEMEEHPDSSLPKSMSDPPLSQQDTIFSSDYWEDVLIGEPSQEDIAYRLSHTQALLQLLSAIEGVIEPEDLSARGYDTEERLTLIVPETEDPRTAATIADLIEDADKLYTICRDILAHEGEETPDEKQSLRLLATDTGSDILTILGGSLVIIALMKQTIESAWEHVQSSHAKTAMNELDTLDEALDLHEKISNLEDTGALQEEEAEIKRNELNAVTRNMLTEGVLTSEMEERARQDTEGLLPPGTRFLPKNDEGGQDGPE